MTTKHQQAYILTYEPTNSSVFVLILTSTGKGLRQSGYVSRVGRPLYNSPQVQLGRTLTRTIVARERDIHEVNAAIKNLKSKKLWQCEMVSVWAHYQKFRKAMDATIHARNIIMRPHVLRMANLVGLKILSPLTGTVEESDFMSAALRDRRGPFTGIAARMMNASKDLPANT